MITRIVVAGLCFFCVWGCAKVRVEAPKEAFKVDISMRLDIYQHVAKDIDAIENIVSGASQKQAAPDIKSSLQDFFADTAYAQEGMNADVEQAAYRRRDRLSQLSQMESAGIVGENKQGLVEVRGPDSGGAGALVSAENSDRMSIYKAIAQKNGTSIDEVQKIYAKRLQADAPAGTPVEAADTGWKTK